MNRCSGCGYIVPASWTECRKCGTPVTRAPVTVPAAAPAPAPAGRHNNGFATFPPPPPPPPPTAPPLDVSFGAPDDALIAGARPRAIGPDTLLVRAAPPPTPPRVNAKTIAIAALALVVVIAGVYSAIPHGKHTKQLPTVLAPRPPSAGLPTNLSDVVRIAAESARHTALETVIQLAGTTGAPLTTAQLEQEQPNYQWIGGDQPSTTNTVISITSGTAVDVIAVSGTDKDICAFGRWSPTLGSEYVTMAHVTNCAATNTPQTGWSTQAGGSAQDLPGVDGN
jgi:hypothetical protein